MFRGNKKIGVGSENTRGEIKLNVNKLNIKLNFEMNLEKRHIDFWNNYWTYFAEYICEV